MSALDNLDNNLSGDSGGGFGSLGGYVNQVYLGEKPAKQVRMKRSGKTITVPAGARTISVQDAKALYLKDPKVEAQWLATLRKNGVNTSDPIKNRALWDIAVAGASDWYATSGGTQKITPEQYANWYLGGQKKATPKADLARSVYQYSPEQIDADINEVAQKVLGRQIVDADKQTEWYKDLTKGLNKMISKGTVTTTELVKNKKTGKLEQVTTQTPGFTKEKAAATIESTLMAEDPASAERKKNLEFANWAFEKMGGRG
jgi:hypothetical protein